MKFLASNSQALLALSLVLGSEALPRRSTLQPVKRALGDYNSTSNCKPWKNDEDSKRLWDDSLAGVLGDDFINENGVAKWAQNLDKEVFDQPTDSWYCYDTDTTCEVDRECSEFAEQKKEGAYYLLLSLQNAVGVMRSVRHYLLEETVNRILDVPQITNDLKQQKSDAKPNVLVLIAATFGMLGGLAAPVAPAAGAAGFASGMFAFMGNVEPPEAPENEEFEGRLASMVQGAFNTARGKLDDIYGAMVGEEGKDQKLIPVEMTKQSFDNTVINALADGQWLRDDPGDGVKETIEDAFEKIRQGLAWTMVRYGRKGFWFIDSDISSDKCGDGEKDHPNEFWHDGADGCAKLMEVKQQNDDGVDLAYTSQEIHDKLFGDSSTYGLDVKDTFENSYNCWKDNDGKIGEVNLKDHDFSDLAATPGCWYGLPMVRGAKFDKWTSDFNNVKMDEFPGNEKGSRWYGRFTDDGLDLSTD